MITVERLCKRFGGLVAVNDVSLTIQSGKITGLIGPNGAGKSTLFNLIAGRYQPTSGRVLLDGADITACRRMSCLLADCFAHFKSPRILDTDGSREFDGRCSSASGERLFNVWLRPGLVRQFDHEIRQKADEVLEFLKLDHIAHLPAGNISGGQKKLLELGRTMMAEPKIVFLDEVGAGVNRTLLYEIGDAIIRLNKERGYTFCLVEHDMDFIAQLCDPVIVMAGGAVMAEGTVAEVKSNQDVIEAYLGHGPKQKRQVK